MYSLYLTSPPLTWQSAHMHCLSIMVQWRTFSLCIQICVQSFFLLICIAESPSQQGQNGSHFTESFWKWSWTINKSKSFKFKCWLWRSVGVWEWQKPSVKGLAATRGGALLHQKQPACSVGLHTFESANNLGRKRLNASPQIVLFSSPGFASKNKVKSPLQMLWQISIITFQTQSFHWYRIPNWIWYKIRWLCSQFRCLKTKITRGFLKNSKNAKSLFTSLFRDLE